MKNPQTLNEVPIHESMKNIPNVPQSNLPERLTHEQFRQENEKHWPDRDALHATLQAQTAKP